MTTRLRLAGLALTALLAAACRSPPESADLGPSGPFSGRLIQPAETSLPFVEQVLFDRDLQNPGNRSEWDFDRGSWESDGLRLPWRGGRASAELRIESVTGLEQVEVALHGKRGSELRLWWRGVDEGFAEARSVHLDANRGVVIQGNRTFTVDLGSLGVFDQAIAGLRFTLVSKGTAARFLKRVRGLRYGLEPSVFEEASVLEDAEEATSFRVDLAQRVRDAVVAPPDKPWTRIVEVPVDGELRFAWGLTARPTVELDLALELRHGNDRQILWQQNVEPGGDLVRWHDVRLPLDAWSEQTVDLIWTVTSEQPFDPRLGLPVWGDVRLVSDRTVSNRTVSRGVDPRPDVILISVDTLRADRVQPVHPPRPTAPRLGAWAAENAVSFENLAVQATWTLPSHTSMLTGLDALTHAVGFPDSRLAPSRTSLTEALRDAGYRTVGITEGGWLDPKFGLDQGFEDYAYRPMEIDESAWWRHMVERSVKLLQEPRRQPLFIFLHNIVVHEYVQRLGSEEPVAAYEATVREMDRELAPLLDLVASPEHRPRTLLALTADHGELLGEQGRRGHGYLHEANIRAPLIIQLPGGEGAGLAIREQAQSIDIVSTVLDVLDLPDLPESQGHSLLPLVRDRPAGALADSERPRIIPIYSSGGDDGLALRTADGLKYVLPNGVPSGASKKTTGGYGEASLWRVDGQGSETALDAETEPQARRLDLMARKYLARVPGLQVEPVACSRQRVLSLRSPGRRLDPAALKRVDLPAGSIRWSQDRAAVELEIAAESSGRLTLELLPEPRIELRIDDPVAGPWRETLELGAPGPPWQRIGEVRRRQIDHGDCSVLLVFRPGHGAIGAGESAEDRRAREKLQALGYLDG